MCGIMKNKKYVPQEKNVALKEIAGDKKEQVYDLISVELLREISNTLKKIEYHLSLSTDVDLEHTNL